MSKSLRVLFMMSSIAMGGGERNIVSFLPCLKTEGLNVMLCTLNTRRDSQLAEVFSQTGITRFDLAARRMVDRNSWKKFVNILRDQEIDIIHAQDQDTIIYAGLARLFLGIPSVMTRHVMIEPVTSWKTALRAQMVFWSACYSMDGVIAVSNKVRQQFAEQASIPLTKIETVYNGIELEKFNVQKRREELRLKLGWQLKRPIAILVSVLRAGKGFETLFEAIPGIRAVIPDFQLKLVGSGELESELKQKAAYLGDAGEFLGQRMDIPDLLGASDLLVQTSWSEALPTVLIEAGAASLPVVATDVGGTAEIVEHGIRGYIVDPGDVDPLVNNIVAVLRNPSGANEMGRFAHDFVIKTFSLSEQVKHTKAFYERILGERNENSL